MLYLCWYNDLVKLEPLRDLEQSNMVKRDTSESLLFIIIIYFCRALKHICHHEKLREDRIEDIVLQSDGDLRNAILSLQFNSRAENSKLKSYLAQ